VLIAILDRRQYLGEERPYVLMRYGMKALVGRNVFYGVVTALNLLIRLRGWNGINSAVKPIFYCKMNNEF